MITFEWHAKKAAQNYRKHQVSFEEAKEVFDDPHGRLMHDPDHSTNEDRFVLLGMSFGLRLLVICHCYRQHDEIIRIISARKATRHEQNKYEEEVT